jgi:uncharacterized membrane protein YoaK (UPF0700 family)
MKVSLPVLLSFDAGFVDTAGFLGLQGLFTAHVTGNFVTLGATLVFGTHGAIGKVLALPEFILVIAIVRLADAVLRQRQLPALRLMLASTATLLIAFFALAVVFGPFPDSDSPVALLTGFAGVAAMAVQNALQRIHFAHFPPTTIMTGNTTQAVLDAVDLIRGTGLDQAPVIRARLVRMMRAIVCFAAGCALAALLYAWVGFWNLLVPVVVGTASAALRPKE